MMRIYTNSILMFLNTTINSGQKVQYENLYKENRIAVEYTTKHQAKNPFIRNVMIIRKFTQNKYFFNHVVGIAKKSTDTEYHFNNNISEKKTSEMKASKLPNSSAFQLIKNDLCCLMILSDLKSTYKTGIPTQVWFQKS